MTGGTRPVILAVDDRRENLLVLETLFDDLDAVLVTTQSGNDALALMLDHDFAVVLMDVQMPGMDGFETVELMKQSKRTRHVPVIYLTAISKERHFVFKGYETGAVDYVFKPVEPEILRSKVKVFLELDRLRRELRLRNADLERLSTELALAAMTDPLTGLHNRRFLLEHITEETALARRGFHGRQRVITPDPHNSDLGFLMIDIDWFKRVNDDHGHDAGDAVLVQFAAVLRDQVRESDVVVRWGGEEFLVLLRQTNRVQTVRVADRMRRRFADQPFGLPGGTICTITCSIGCCAYPLGDPEDFDWDQVVALADWALRRAKTAGRDRVLGVELGEQRVDLEARRQILRDPESACLAGNLRLVKADAG